MMKVLFLNYYPNSQVQFDYRRKTERARKPTMNSAQAGGDSSACSGLMELFSNKRLIKILKLRHSLSFTEFIPYFPLNALFGTWY